MENYAQIEFSDIQENEEYKELIQKVVRTCFEEEHLEKTNLYLNIILTNPETIRQTNKTYREIDKETDVLSFPMFQKEEIDNLIEESKNEEIEVEDVLGDIMIAIPRMREQANTYGHSEIREYAFLIAHSMLHLMGYDHMTEEEAAIMEEKQEAILEHLGIRRIERTDL